ncbi:MAG: murein biosynthesis integral membrane protein MurJ, partial [Propionibacteriaceae bacterium]|nr:murein biosynthesis integral membrane protein MurJ [Propionibacteriaceae bacterium]
MTDTLAAAEERFSHVTRNSSVMAMGTLGSRVLGFVRTAIFMMIAQTTVAADAFTTANNLPSSIYAVIATGVVSGILVPQITKAMKRQDGGEDFVNRLLTLSLLVVAGSAIVCTVGTPLITDLVVSSKANLNVPGFLHLTILLGYWCMPQVFFYGLYTVLGQVLNARG